MKLLLTSSGISKGAIGKALLEMAGKPASETKIGFVPTAANPEGRNKDWLVRQYLDLWRYGFSWIDIIDPSAAGVDWEARLAEVDVVYLSGGNTSHLLDQARKTGFDVWLKENIESKVYVGGGASSILMTPSIAVAAIDGLGDVNIPNLTDLTGLGYVDFEIAPHYEIAMQEALASYAATAANPVYAIDDQTAIQVVDGTVTVVSSGTWELYR